jgi:hypothetical protein
MFSGRTRSSGQIDVGKADREFAETYRTIVSGMGVRTDEQEMNLINELIRRAKVGSYPEDGSMHIVSPTAQVEWSSDDAQHAVQLPPERNYGLLAGGLLISLAIVIALISIVRGDGKGSGDGRDGRDGKDDASIAMSETATAISSNSASETPSLSESEATQTAVAQATAVWGNIGIEVGTDYKQKLPTLYPETLELGGVPFRVYPSAIDNGEWPYQSVEGTASWIGGTLINWCFGVPALDSNITLFDRLDKAANGDRVALLRMSGGLVRRYQLQKPVQVERQQIEVFAQNWPGITIVLVGDEQGTERWIILGNEDQSRRDYEDTSATNTRVVAYPAPTFVLP